MLRFSSLREALSYVMDFRSVTLLVGHLTGPAYAHHGITLFSIILNGPHYPWTFDLGNPQIHVEVVNDTHVIVF